MIRIICGRRSLGKFYHSGQHVTNIRNFAKVSAAAKPVQWEAVIGLEIHAQLKSQSKLFSGSESQFAAPVNTLVSYFDASIPGTLPVLNRRCVEAGIRTALALNSHINLVSLFDRKHYFYADLPAGYQITQQRCPLAVKGEVGYRVSARNDSDATSENVNPETKGGEMRTCRLIQLQLEQDSGKSLHDVEQGNSLIDLNRAGIGLLEIVTEPDFRTSLEAMSFVKELRRILLTIDTCDCRMEEGSLRVDASVSIRRPGDELGTRAEVKNLNSVKALGRAVDFEIRRQIELLENGEIVTNETRAFDSENGVTVAMRDKERLHDYRFMAEPNLPPLRVYDNNTVGRVMESGVPLEEIFNIDEIRAELPELPAQKRARLGTEYGLIQEHCDILVNEMGLSEMFESCVRSGHNSRVTALLLISDLLNVLNDRSIELQHSYITSQHIGDLVTTVQAGVISREAVVQILGSIVDSRGKKSVSEVIKEQDLEQCSDATLITQVCLKIMNENPKEVAQYRRGRTKTINFFIGRVLKHFDRKVNAKMVTDILKDKLSRTE